MTALVTDTVRGVHVLTAIKAAGGLTIDPRLRGEMAWFFENRGLRAHYYRRNGMTVDQLGEMLLDRGYVITSPTEREVIDILADLFTTGRRQRNETARERSHDADIQRQAEVRRTCRLRLYECAECGKKHRVADDNDRSFHLHVDPDTLTERFVPFILKTVVLNQSTPF